jgi:alpha-ribazole phosphatase
VTRQVLLVRHTEVALRWTNRCYGRIDIGVSRTGQQHAAELAAKLAGQCVTALIHSGLKRASYLAHSLGNRTGIEPVADPRWQERNFGTWEGRGWHSIWKETGNAMDGMFTDPQTYRPGGGETTAEVAERSVAAWNALPREGVVVVVSHGGPIAAVRTMLASAPITQILDYRVDIGSIVTAL